MICNERSKQKVKFTFEIISFKIRLIGEIKSLNGLFR